MSDEKPKSRRGFAAMDPAKVKAIASLGGQSVPKEKRAFSIQPELAASAGRKGGRNVDAERRSFSQDRALASSAGKIARSRRKSRRAEDETE
ncbi:general stress protein [Camelimonas fluminis]|uniref:General stress protein n=1 Tax=Camelimonas fluminis TaxID=1576911 RepID=A0ABV7UE40_9HYPH|nr:KGG domain-containing protein [Camelimonas fluminis]